MASYFLGHLLTETTTAGSARAISGSSISQTFDERLAGSQRFDVSRPDQLTIECANGLAYGFSDDGTLWSFALTKLLTPG